jgi:drug/metabolite transporter (DMT)-like permease
MSPLALLYITGTIIAASLWRIIVKTKTKPTVHDLAFSALIDASAAIVGFIFLGVSGFDLTIPKTVTPWILFGVSIAIATLADYLILVSSKYADVADTSILLPLSNLWIALIASLVLGEQVTPMRWAAIGCIVVGSMIAIAKTGKLLLNRGIVAILIYGVITAIMMNIDKGVSSQYSMALYVTGSYGISSILMFVVLGKQRVDLVKKEWNRQGWWLVVIGGIWAIFSLMILAAYRLADVSTVIPFMRLFIVITTAYSLIFLKERDRLIQKIIGSIIVTIGAIVLAYVG